MILSAIWARFHPFDFAPVYGMLVGMRISDEDLEEFKRIYAAEFGEELSQAEASEAASNLVELYMLLAQPLPSEQNKNAT